MVGVTSSGGIVKEAEKSIASGVVVVMASWMVAQGTGGALGAGDSATTLLLIPDAVSSCCGANIEVGVIFTRVTSSESLSSSSSSPPSAAGINIWVGSTNIIIPRSL